MSPAPIYQRSQSGNVPWPIVGIVAGLLALLAITLLITGALVMGYALGATDTGTSWGDAAIGEGWACWTEANDQQPTGIERLCGDLGSTEPHDERFLYWGHQ